MNQWEIALSRESLKFLRKNHLPETTVIEAVTSAIKKMSGETINLDLKKLHPPYEDHFRIRNGKLRIVFKINFEVNFVHVIEINWRGSAYRK
ncbi:MAG: hypothetical protein AAB455_02820 [Patescibacteria group bacterium]